MMWEVTRMARRISVSDVTPVDYKKIREIVSEVSRKFSPEYGRRSILTLNTKDN